MKRSVHAITAAALLAAGAAGFASSASAQTSVYLQAGPPPVYVTPPRAYPRYYAYESHEYDHFARHACRASGWDPNARYMPGDAVWRNGHLYVATDVSARVWNVNSPPEWTPNYWVRARCR